MTPDDGLQLIIPLAEGPDGSFWFLSGRGSGPVLLRYYGLKWQLFTSDKGFVSPLNGAFKDARPILDATVGPDGALWIGGLRFQPGGPPLTLPAELAQ